jgi:predicted dienelactone hydrolase
LRYNPFARGPYPVGVRTIQLADTERNNRPVTVEIWYPAAARYRGQDLDPATRDRFTFAPEMPEASQDAVRNADPAGGQFPLVMHNHGFFGHRRVNTTLCTHLASHGYIVASNDVPGNTTGDLMNDVIAHRRGGRPTAPPPQEINRTRVAIASFVIESVTAGAEPLLADHLDATRVGACGQSAGGWTTLGLNSVNQRMAASFAIEPTWGNRGMLPEAAEMASELRLNDWGRPVPTFVLAGEVDRLIVLEDLRELYTKLRAPKAFANLRGAGHWHFNDNAEAGHETFRQMYLTSFPDDSFDTRALGIAMRPFAELCSEAHAADTQRALCLAHMDAHLKDNDAAAAFLDDNLAEAFARRGIDLEVAAPVRVGYVAAVM